MKEQDLLGQKALSIPKQHLMTFSHIELPTRLSWQHQWLHEWLHANCSVDIQTFKFLI